MAYRGDTGDPYVAPETGVLRNIAGLGDSALLEEYEGEMSIMRQIELLEAPLPASFDFAHLKAIHRYLFQDVYAWAGEPRTVDMAKG
jgi:cell filamentation protein